MKSTPALPPTAAAASTIWSGVGEVKICPGHAASSIPFRQIRRAAAHDRCRRRRSARLCRQRAAAAYKFALRSERDDIGMRRGETIEALRQHRIDGIDEFFHALLPCRVKMPSGHFSSCKMAISRRANSCSKASTFPFRLAFPRSGKCSVIDRSRGVFGQLAQPSRMRAGIRAQESRPWRAAEMTDVENRIEVLDGHREPGRPGWIFG